MLNKILKNKTAMVSILIFIVTIVAQGYNLWHYPMLLGDEGSYTARAWWIIHFGKLDLYTYWYDHYFLGWLIIGLWLKLTGGLFTFGYTIFSTRIFIILLNSVTNVILYLIGKQITKSHLLGVLGSVLFALSPLAIYYHRQVLLDNIMVFWLAFSMYFLLKCRSNLLYVFLGSISLGIAFLTKESAIFFIPGLFYLTTRKLSSSNRKYGIFIWVATTIFLFAQLPLLSMIRGEFFPSGWFGNNTEHVSIVETYAYQSQRGTEISIFDPNSDFRSKVSQWLYADKALIIAGLASFLVITYAAKKTRKASYMVAALLYAGYAVFLIRGGVVLYFYVIPLIATSSIVIPLSLSYVLKLFRIQRANEFILEIILVISIYYVSLSKEIYTYDAVTTQLNVIEYIRNSIPDNSVVAVNHWAYTDLKFHPSKGEGHKLVEWFYKIDLDPEIRDTKLSSDWKNIDYIVEDFEFTDYLANTDDLTMLKQAYDNSNIVAEFGDNSTKYSKIRIRKVEQ